MYKNTLHTTFNTTFRFTPIDKDIEVRTSPPPVKPSFTRSLSSQSVKRHSTDEADTNLSKKSKTI